jgi:large subunit ribosomal protein L6
MSRVGKKPIPVPAGVEVKSHDGAVRVKGPKGANEWSLPAGFRLQVEGGTATILCDRKDMKASALHGLSRALINNMVLGVTQGWSKTLEIEGMGYKADVKGRNVELQVGYSHLVLYPLPEGVDAKCESPTKIVVSGIDRGKVGQVAANLRAFRPPEPYKGKGIRYEGEQIRRKAGKSAGAA